MKYFYLILILPFVFTSCLKDDCQTETEWIVFEPVTISFEEFRSSPLWQTDRELKNAGKIYVYGDLLLINEIREGIHFFNNADPTSPMHLGFIKIPGNVDMAIKDGYLYADNYTDLLTIDIKNLSDITLVDRDQNMFSSHYPVTENENEIIIDYKETKQSEFRPCSQNFWLWENGRFLFNMDNASTATANVSVPSNISGISGSMARFTLVEDKFYALSGINILTSDISDPSDPFHDGSLDASVNANIETIYPVKDKLFIGSTTGMFIYEISEQGQPVYAGSYQHWESCDPVFVKEDRAYVTLRDGRTCQGALNQLDVIDITDIYSPQLITSYPMANPHGLSVVDNYLIICEGKYGWKTFNSSDDHRINEQMYFFEKSHDAFDVIGLSDKHVIVTGANGIFQYDISAQTPVLLSTIST